ncbi:MAG: response regulator [Planctomycetota bacterium]
MATRQKKVLVVDDEQDVLTYLSTLLGDAGYAVEVAKDGQQAIELALRDPPDLVSLDITMPEKTGVKFYREIRDNPATSKIPIVIVTGITNPWASPSGRGGFKDFISSRRQVPPPDGYFEKPIVPAEYLQKIAELIGPP